ncbi:MAG: agmatinase [Candidatus Bilamarchaeaceae archaeon]
MNKKDARGKTCMELQFLERNAPFEKAKVCVLPVPYAGTVCFRKGAENGPKAIMEASLEVEEYDVDLGMETIGGAFPEGFHVMQPVRGGKRKPEEVVADVESAIGKVLDTSKFPIALGGEHSISAGAVAAVKKRFPSVSVLQIDAHADLRDEYQGSKHSHACAMRRIRDIVPRCAQVGVRSMSAECADYIEKHAKGRVWGAEFRNEDVLAALGKEVYITIDLDGFDPSEMPGVGTPCPGGISFRQGISLLKEVCKRKKVVGFDVVELAPIRGNVVSELFAANLTYKLAGYSLFAEKLR